MNAVIYARYSSDSQREESIEGQIRECTEYAKRNGMMFTSTTSFGIALANTQSLKVYHKPCSN